MTCWIGSQDILWTRPSNLEPTIRPVHRCRHPVIWQITKCNSNYVFHLLPCYTIEKSESEWMNEWKHEPFRNPHSAQLNSTHKHRKETTIYKIKYKLKPSRTKKFLFCCIFCPFSSSSLLWKKEQVVVVLCWAMLLRYVVDTTTTINIM